MHVKELARIAGTTPRAVRHYHHLGLLEIPPTVRGRREYGVEHVARLMRIRWLADGGLSLTQVADMLASDTIGTDQDSRREAVLRDLRRPGARSRRSGAAWPSRHPESMNLLPGWSAARVCLPLPTP